MSDEIGGAPSTGASEAVSDAGTSAPDVSQGSEQSQDQPVSSSSREAVTRALASAGLGEPETAQQRADRGDGRDATGKFVGKEPLSVVAPPTTETPEGAAPPVLGQAPSGFTKEAQADWAKTPEPVRRDIERRIGELTQGLEGYKAIAEPVRQFDEMARQSGTTLAAALDNYVGIEQILRQDIGQGTGHIWQKTGVNPVEATARTWNSMGLNPQAMIRALIEGFGGQPEGQPQGGDTPQVAALKQHLATFEQKFGRIEQSLQQNAHQQQMQQTQATVEKFAAAHPYFDELSEPISQMIATRFAKDLSDAYDKAVRLSPEIAAKIEADKLAKGKPDPAQHRKAGLSITGTPSPGSSPSTKPPAGSSREALQRAAASLGI